MIKIGNLDIDKLYLGSSYDVKVYLGDTKLYPSEEPTPTPTPTYQWKQYNVGDILPSPADLEFCYGIKFGYPNTSNIENAMFNFSNEENSIFFNFMFDTQTSKWVSAYMINDGEPVEIDLSRYYNETEECYAIYFSDFGFGAMLLGHPRDILEYGPIQLYEEVTPASN